MKLAIRMLLGLVFISLLSPLPAQCADLVIAEKGKTDYQIVVPDKAATANIGDCLQQTARLFQAALQANGFEAPIVAESKREPMKPGIYLGDTAFARGHGVDTSKLKGWTYIHKAVGRDVIIAGRDHAAPPRPDESRIATFDRIATAKGVVDFLRQHVGVRFLFPDLGPAQSIKAAASVNFLESPAFEFLKTPTIAVPENLNVQFTPLLEFNVSWPLRGSFYDLANNRLPEVDTAADAHTYERAIPSAKYRKTNPEYFALVGGQRLLDGVAQYCISNPEVQDLIYKDILRWIDNGYEAVGIGQPDGFRGCQCENCEKLYDKSYTWNDKIWTFHRNLAAQVDKERPGKQIVIMSYIQTELPPKTFKEFPKNTRIMLTGTNEEDIAPWRAVEIAGGFSGSVYNWCPNLSTRYTPMRTPRTIEEQAKRLSRNHIKAIYRDGTGSSFGLEGPVYYTMGRMFDDPEKNQAKVLVHEFCDAAYGKAAPNMVQFFDQLYHAIELYSEYLGTRDPAWTYKNMYGQRKRFLYDPFQLLGFLYTPNLLASLETHLAQAEKTAATDKAKIRIALVRREFDYVRSLVKVIHLYHAFQIAPDIASRDRLLNAIDARNAEIDGYFDAKGRTKMQQGWSFVMFPPIGHDAKHMRLGYNGYQEPFLNTPVNWDTRAMRTAPLPGLKRLTAKFATGAIQLESPQWAQAEAHELAGLPRRTKPSRATSFRTLADDAHLYVRVESDLPAPMFGDSAESLSVFITPPSGKDIAYQFGVGLRADSKHDAANGFNTDPLDPRFGKFDPDWNGAWTYDVRLDSVKHRWLALIKIPFKTLGVDAPKSGELWRCNVSRIHREGDRIEHSLWSATASAQTLDDRNDFGEIVFQANDAVKQPQKSSLLETREKLYQTSFEIPEAWKKLPYPLPNPFQAWSFRKDVLDQGVKNGWFRADYQKAEWAPIRVPSFWAENETIGKYEGFGWYRTTFQLPAEWKGKAIRLGFGAVDEQAWVYVNSHLVREHTEKSEKRSFTELWDVPFTAEVMPGHLSYGQPNVLVVRVHNALANGGIWRPVVVHALDGSK